ncbi:hypothetical protein [Raoultibacter phocaeensis]|uniref:hypothetical protein n=1 Tax=Raoultibacter phocaeensis TaxID=2479841 RepID=UPI001118AA1A|nr:hypothetical protein [Raoultibacter phocaeensis]
MIENVELQELYSLIADVCNGYNKTHETQVSYVDFTAALPDEDYSGAVVCREYPKNIIDYHYRDLRDDDFDWEAYADYTAYRRRIDAIRSDWVRRSQRAHREGTMSLCYWLDYPYFAKGRDYID